MLEHVAGRTVRPTGEGGGYQLNDLATTFPHGEERVRRHPHPAVLFDSASLVPAVGPLPPPPVTLFPVTGKVGDGESYDDKILQPEAAVTNQQYSPPSPSFIKPRRRPFWTC